MKHIKLHHQINRFSFLAILLILISFNGCVSKKKYEEAMQKIASYQVENTFQEYNKVDSLYSQSMIYFAQKDTIRALRKEIDSLNLVLKTGNK